MLNPDSRQTLIDALRPPLGYRLGCAVGTTYSLNLDAALTPPAAFALHSVSAERDPGDNVEPIELLDAIRRHSGLFTIFFQSGQIPIPTSRKLFTYLEGGLVPVTAPEGGVFHPKIWALRFDKDKSESVFRMLCSSRNLTHDRSWDTMLRLDSTTEKGRSRIKPGGLAEMVRALPELAIAPLEKRRAKEISRLADQLNTVKWALPAGMTAGRFRPIGLNASSRVPFPKSADRMAVISPFLSAGLIGRLPAARRRAALVSNAHQLGMCSDSVSAKFSEVFTLDSDASPLGDDPAVDASGKPNDEQSLDDPGVPFRGLHAKLFVFDRGEDTTILTGSANATSAAFGKNVEFLTELVGPTKRFGVESLLAEPSDGVQSLRGFLEPFELREQVGPDPIDQLDGIRLGIASVPLEVRATEDGSDEKFQLRFSSAAAFPDLPDGVTWRAWPVTLDEHAASEVLGAATLDATFTTTFEGITAFLANELRLGKATTRFVLCADLREAPANRDTRLLRILLENSERFLRYLLMLLADEDDDPFGLAELLNAFEKDADDEWRIGFDSLPLLEVMLRALAHDPARLREAHRLITDLRKATDGNDPLLDELDRIWNPIWSVAKETTA